MSEQNYLLKGGCESTGKEKGWRTSGRGKEETKKRRGKMQPRWRRKEKAGEALTDVILCIPSA